MLVAGAEAEWGVSPAPTRSAGVILFRPCHRCIIDHKRQVHFELMRIRVFYYCSISIRGPSTRHCVNACVLSIQSPPSVIQYLPESSCDRWFPVDAAWCREACQKRRYAQRDRHSESREREVGKRGLKNEANIRTVSSKYNTRSYSMSVVTFLNSCTWVQMELCLCWAITLFLLTVQLNQILHEQTYQRNLKDLSWWWNEHSGRQPQYSFSNLKRWF